ncbi:MAG TPA: FkbM family methyltransferase [Terriglobales bacterium]|nr:FkbM family methyltransferase [Terriglobales bacterium]
MELIRGFERNIEAFGVIGTLRVLSNRVIHAPRKMACWPPNAKFPVSLRLGTTDIAVYRQNLIERQYEFPLPFTPRTIVDAGANIGMASIFFANRYPEARIVAIEPEAGNFKMLTENIRPYPQIEAIQAALWSSDGEVSLHGASGMDGSYGDWGFTVGEGSGTPALSILALIRRFLPGMIDLLKIDIEGAELELFAKADWVRHVRCIMIETHDRFRPGCSEAVRAALGERWEQRGETAAFLVRER